MSTSFGPCRGSKSKSWITIRKTQNGPWTTNTSTFHSLAARRASSTELTMTKTSVLCGFSGSLFSSYARTCSTYFPRLVPKANQMAAGSSSRTAGMRGSSEISVLSRIQPRSPTPVGRGIPAAMLSLERTYCSCFLRVSELSKHDSFYYG